MVHVMTFVVTLKITGLGVYSEISCDDHIDLPRGRNMFVQMSGYISCIITNILCYFVMFSLFIVSTLIKELFSLQSHLQPRELSMKRDYLEELHDIFN